MWAFSTLIKGSDSHYLYLLCIDGLFDMPVLYLLWLCIFCVHYRFWCSLLAYCSRLGSLCILRLGVLKTYHALNQVYIYKQFSLFYCLWSRLCDYARTPNWPSRTAHHTSSTCCQTRTSISAPSCRATKARWKRWVTMSTFVFSWRIWPRRPSRPLVFSRMARRGCSRRILSPGEGFATW